MEPQHTFIIAEIGINHQGSIELFKKMIVEAKRVGADAVKGQKRAQGVPHQGAVRASLRLAARFRTHLRRAQGCPGNRPRRLGRTPRIRRRAGHCPLRLRL